MSKNVLVAEDTRNKEGEDFGIQGNLKEENVLPVAETKNKALIDTGCSATVAGQDWARILVGSLSEEIQARVENLSVLKHSDLVVGNGESPLGF